MASATASNEFGDLAQNLHSRFFLSKEAALKKCIVVLSMQL